LGRGRTVAKAIQNLKATEKTTIDFADDEIDDEDEDETGEITCVLLCTWRTASKLQWESCLCG
jgi:hypothetical protein